MNVSSLYTIFKSSTGVTTDSRNCPDGSVFFALKGDNFNGNTYAQMALDSGCAYAVVDEIECAKDKRFLLVDDVLTSLQELANYHRKTLGTPIIGITGSNGKTTTKELLAAVLETKFSLHYTQGNFNNHIGVPLTLLLLKEEHEMAIVEMGANHPGEIAELCSIAEPDMGIITNIGKAHLEGFGGIEGVIKTKKELYDFLRQKGGVIYVNGQDELLLSLSEGMKRLCYNDETAVYKVLLAGAIPALKLEIVCDALTEELQTQMVGEYNAINVAAALAIGADLGVSFQSMKQALEAYVPSNNRSQILETGKNRIVLDAYNANPASMAVAIDNFSKLDVSNKMVMLGAMKELGDYSKAEHEALVALVVKSNFVQSIFVGEEFSLNNEMPKDVLFFKSTDALRIYLNDAPIMGATVLVKGSRSMKMESLVELL